MMMNQEVKAIDIFFLESHQQSSRYIQHINISDMHAYYVS